MENAKPAGTSLVGIPEPRERPPADTKLPPFALDEGLRDKHIDEARKRSGDTRPLRSVDVLELTLGGSGELRPKLGSWRPTVPAPAPGPRKPRRL